MLINLKKLGGLNNLLLALCHGFMYELTIVEEFDCFFWRKVIHLQRLGCIIGSPIKGSEYKDRKEYSISHLSATTFDSGRIVLVGDSECQVSCHVSSTTPGVCPVAKSIEFACSNTVGDPKELLSTGYRALGSPHSPEEIMASLQQYIR